MEILVVEDSTADAYLTTEALREGMPGSHVTVVRDGEQALAFLRRSGVYATATRPDLILLDINLPRMTGFELLAALLATPDLHDIPVVMLSTSDFSADKDQAHALGARLYLQKPIDLDAYLALGHTIAALWQQGLLSPAHT